MTNAQRARPEPVQFTALGFMALLMFKTAQTPPLIVLNVERASFGVFEAPQFAIRVPAPCFASMLACCPVLQAPFSLRAELPRDSSMSAEPIPRTGARSALRHFLDSEAAGGLLLMGAAALALIVVMPSTRRSSRSVSSLK